MNFDPAVVDAIQKFTAASSAVNPQFADIIARLKRGELNDVAAMRELMILVQEQQLGPELERVAEGAFASLREPTTALVDQNPENPPPIVHRQNGLPMLNPLVEAAILERLQFDGDAPELRTGPLPAGVLPAVPVDTTARNLVSVGVQLQTAAQEVATALQGEQARFHEQAVALLGDAPNETTAIARGRESGLAIPTGTAGYEAGQPPALRAVAPPTGSALAAMTPEEQRASAWKALSTTQGRRSALAVLEELILVGLASEGFEMRARPQQSVAEVPVYGQWTCRMSGPESTQSQFNFIDTAARSLLRQLVAGLQTRPVPDPVLEVFTINTVDIRQVGWGARVVSA